MFLCLLFWFGLLLPGYVVLRLVSPQDLKTGLMGTIGLSYLAVFALLSPVSILGYLLHLPVVVVSGACVLAFLAAVIYITRRGWWRDIGGLMVAALGVELCMVAADLVLSARVGAFMRGDAKTHVARIRSILDQGLTNLDPYVSSEHFFPIYHTKIIHALHAACAQLTQVDILEEWFTSLVWAKLAIAGGCYFMGWALFERRWVAWLTVVFVMATRAPVTFLIYPNQLSTLWLLPIMVGFAAQACRMPCSWKTPLKLAAGSLVLGQTHGLYAMFAGVGLGPFLGTLFLVRLVRRRPDRWCLGACVLALFAAAPFMLVGKAKMAEQSDFTTAEVAADKRFYHFENGWSVRKPGRPIGYVLLGLGVAGAVVGNRRKQAGILIAAAGTAAIILYTPPVCTKAIELSGQPFTVARMTGLISLAQMGLMPGALAFLVESRLRFRWLQALVSIVVFLLATQLAPSEKKHDWPFYWETAKAPRKVRHQWLAHLRRSRAFFQAHIPRGVTVLTDEDTAMWLVMLRDCRVVIPKRGSYGVTDVRQRKADLQAMLAPETPWNIRRGLLAKYDINLFLVGRGGPKAIEWAQGHVKEHWKGGGYLLLALALD